MIREAFEPPFGKRRHDRALILFCKLPNFLTNIEIVTLSPPYQGEKVIPCSFVFTSSWAGRKSNFADLRHSTPLVSDITSFVAKLYIRTPLLPATPRPPILQLYAPSPMIYSPWLQTSPLEGTKVWPSPRAFVEPVSSTARINDRLY